MSDKNENLEGFEGWDNNIPEVDFFGESTEPASTDVTDVISEVENDTVEDKTDLKTDTKKEQEETPEVDFFESEESQETENTETSAEDDKENKDTANDSVLAVKVLKEKGLIDFELEEGTELTPEIAEEILEDSFEEKVEQKIKDLFDELPQVVKDLNTYVLKGGDVKQFFNTIAKQNEVGITPDIDLSEEANQELVIRNHLKSEGYDEDYIESQIEFLKDSNKLERIAEVHFNKWKKNYEKERAKLVEEQKERERREKENRREFKKEITNFINETENLNGLKLSKEDKKVLPQYMTDRSIKLENGNVITPMQKDLYEALRDKNKVVLLAKLLKNGFNFKDIELNAETKVTKKIKENIRRSKIGTPSKAIKGSSQKQQRSLADYF